MASGSPASGSYRESLKSWCYLHNETGREPLRRCYVLSNHKIRCSVNIFSHLIGSVLFFSLPFIIYRELQPRYESANTADIVVFTTFFFGVAICFALSVMLVLDALRPMKLLS